MSFIEAILLGVLEGATEFLPISSTGHLILASHVLEIPETNFLTSFIIAIQLGAIAAVAITYWRSFFDVDVIKRLIVAFLPTAVIGFALYKVAKEYLLNNQMVVVIALLLGGIALIALELWHRKRTEVPGTADVRDIRYRDAFAIGLFQSIAIIPGVSRSGASIAGGLLLGIRRVAIVEFSFLLAAPTMAAATGYDILKNYQTFTWSDAELLLAGGIAAFVVALLALWFLKRFVQKYSFIPFGVYRIALALVFLMFVL